MKFQYLCEVCDRKEELSEEEAFNSGWDYPPNMGEWGVISPRTCPDCPIEKTVWWRLAVEKTAFENLSQKEQETIKRITEEAPEKGFWLMI